MKERVLASVAALALGWALALLVVAGDLGQLGTQVLGTYNDDALGAIHLHHDFHDALAEGRLDLVDPDQLVPAGSDRWLREGGNSLEMLVSRVFRALAPWPAWLNLAGLAWIPLNLLAFVPLGRHLWGRWGPALAAGAAWAVLPPVLSQLGAMRLTQMVLVGVPIAVLGFLELAEGRRRGWWVCGLGMALTAWGYWFYGFFLVLLAPVFAVWILRAGRGVELLKAAALAMGLSLPLASRPLLAALSGAWTPSSPASAEFTSPVFADALQLAGPQSAHAVGWCPWILVLGFVATAVWGKRRGLWACLAAVCVVMSLGPAQQVGELLWRLPSYPLWRWVPGFDRMLHPERWLHVGGLFLVVLAADGLSRWRPWASWVLPAGVVLQVMLTVRLGTWAPTVPGVYAAVPSAVSGLVVVPVLESPLSCAWLPFHGKRLLGGMGENQPWFRPPAFEIFVEGNGLLMQLWRLGRGEDLRVQVYQADLDQLRDEGLDGIVLDAGAWAHAPLTGRVDARARLEEAFGQPLVDDVSGQLWTLPTRGLDGAPPSFGPLRNEGPPGPPP